MALPVPRFAASLTFLKRSLLWSRQFPRSVLLLFLVLVSVWTYLLVKPQPFPETAKLLLSWSDVLLFLASKLLHLLGYAGLTGLLILGTPWFSPRWAAFMMMVHGALSEMGQFYGNRYWQTGRGGSLRDVLIDAVGVLLGLIFMRVVSAWLDSPAKPDRED